jgi:hypothetical protein
MSFARAKQGRCRVAAVILKPCLWRDIPIDNQGGRLGHFLVTPRDGKPVTRWPGGQDAALDSAVEDIKRLITDKNASADVVYERDVWLADAIWRAFLGTWDLPPHEERAPEGQSENQRFYDLATKEFRQAAFDGRLPIWAKRSKGEHTLVLEPLDMIAVPRARRRGRAARPLLVTGVKPSVRPPCGEFASRLRIRDLRRSCSRTSP